MMVDSSATTAPPLASASSTSADTATPAGDRPSLGGAIDITAIVPRQTTAQQTGTLTAASVSASAVS
jgi:hypothetical protein